MTRNEQLAYVVGLIEYSKLDSFSLEQAIKFAKRNGIESSMHVGKSQAWFDEDLANRAPEYLMGQFVDGFERKQFLGYNSCVNLSMMYLHGEWPKKEAQQS